MNIPNTMSDEFQSESLPEPLASVVAQIAATTPDPEDSTAVVDLLKGNPPAEVVTRAAKELGNGWRRMMFAGVAVAAAVLLVMTLGRLPKANALERIADALASKPCIKMTSTHKGTTRESWIMPAMRQSATRSDEWIRFFDANAETVVTHNRKTGELVRSIKFRHDFGFVSDLVSAIIASSKGNAPEKIRGMKVISSKLETVDGNSMLTLELDPTSMRGVKEDATATAKITVDPATDLPVRCVATLNDGGNSQTITDVWTYPKESPANIYALGVDRSTKLVDRVPSTAVKPVLAGLYGGRLTFDDYVGVSIQTHGKEDVNFGSGAGDFVLAAKQGSKFLFARLENTGGFNAKVKGKTRAEAAEFILANLSDFELNPLVIVDGLMEHRCGSTDVTSVEINVPLEEFIVPSWHSIPHYAGRPPTGIGSGDISGALVTEAKGGPDACVLLQANRDGEIPRAPDPEAGKRSGRAIDKGGYWIRADRDYLVMKQTANFGENKSSFVLDSLAQSPKGFWYATKATMRYNRANKDTADLYHYSYHLDFNQKLPEVMFDPSNYYAK